MVDCSGKVKKSVIKGRCGRGVVDNVMIKLDVRMLLWFRFLERTYYLNKFMSRVSTQMKVSRLNCRHFKERSSQQ